MTSFSIYICGVGGQGIGLLSEILLRGCDYAGFPAKAVDTHGLAQRGGVVVSQLRLGTSVHTPMISNREADLCVALERHEALRGADIALRNGGTLIYYNTVLQPLGVRLGQDQEVSEKQLEEYCSTRSIKVIAVHTEELADPRMQNIAVLGRLTKHSLIPGLAKKHLLLAMEDLMPEKMLKNNTTLLGRVCRQATEED